MRRLSTIALLVMTALPTAALAADVTLPAAQARDVAQVVCADRQGSGALTRVGPDGAYVVTAGHVAIDPKTGMLADGCRVGFVADPASPPGTFFDASIVHAMLDDKTDRDFAVLKLGARVFGDGDLPAVPMKTDEFAAVGDPLTVYGFPSGSTDKMQQSAGKVLAYSRGTLRSDAVIQEGYSGGPVADAAGALIGVAARVTYTIDPKTGQEKGFVYEMGDVMSLIGWLDSFGAGEHDRFLTHADPARFDAAPFVVRNEDPGCAYVVRTVESPTVYCLLETPFRLVFPNEATFRSWYPGQEKVDYVTVKNLGDFRLIGNVTMKAGSLVKITTDPKVYAVSDSFGTLRWVPTEERARAIFGSDWATKVRDVPDEFFADYKVGPPLQ